MGRAASAWSTAPVLPAFGEAHFSAALRKVSRAQSAGLPVVGSFSLLGKIRARQRPWFSLSVCGFCSSNPSPGFAAICRAAACHHPVTARRPSEQLS